MKVKAPITGSISKRLGAVKRSRTIIVAFVALVILAIVGFLVQAAGTKKLSSTAGATVVWGTASNWDPSGEPTAADDVIFDYTNETGATKTTLVGLNAANKVANSLTFGGSTTNGALPAFELRANSGASATARTLTLGTSGQGGAGSITVHSTVTGAQSVGTNSGTNGLMNITPATGVPGFAVTNNSPTQTLNLAARLLEGATPGSTLTVSSSGGVVQLGGANTYTGATTINSGTVLVTGSTASGSSVAVNTSATLGGSGTVGGSVTVNSGGAVAPGVSPGVLNTGSVTFASGSTFSVEVGGTTAGSGYDQLNVTGAVSPNGATLSLIQFGGFTPAVGQTFTIINNDDNADTISTTFAGLIEGATITNFLGSSLNATITYAGGSGSNDVVITVTCPSSLTVNDIGDGADATPGDGICATAGAVCTLRAAIQEANALTSCSGAITINFSISGSGVKAITPGSIYPAITRPVIIDGTTQAGASCTTAGGLTIELNGTSAGATGAQAGLQLDPGASGSTIKGLVINRFTNYGMFVSSSSNNVQCNYIGTNVAGTSGLGNSNAGIRISGNSNVVGGSVAGNGNLISGNSSQGIRLAGTGNQVQGNYVGINAAGTAIISNGGGGVDIQGSANTTVGGTSAGARNVISGHAGGSFGIAIQGSSSNTIVQGNYIGTDATGTSGLGNSRGVNVGTGATGTTIGGIGAGEANVIAFNSLEGVVVFAFGTTINNSSRGNSIYSNGGLGIDLNGDGLTANDNKDPDSGPNNLQNFPVLTAPLVGATTVSGTLNSTVGQTFTIDVYSNDACDGSGNGEGKTYLGSTTTSATDSNGDVSFNVTVPAVVAGKPLTATATDANGNTSEFSACVSPATPGETDVTASGGVLTVTDGNGGNTNDTLTISLVAGPNIRVNDPTNTLACGVGTTQVNPNTCEVPQSSITSSIQINTLAGNDTVTLSLAGGNFIPASGGVSYAGGDPTTGPGDKLIISGGAQGTVQYNYTNANDGNIVMSNFGTVNYTGLEPISNSGTATDVFFNLPPAVSNSATLSDLGGGSSRLSSTGTFEQTDFANPSNSLTITGGAFNDALNVNALASSFPSLTINGNEGTDSVNFNGNITFAANANLDVNLQNDGPTPGIDTVSVTAELTTSGTGTIDIRASEDVIVNSPGRLQTENGNLTVEANQQSPSTDTEHDGVQVNGATVASIGTGNITVKGRGGEGEGDAMYGVIVWNAGKILSTGTGTITVEGTGGARPSGVPVNSELYGVYVYLAGSEISSSSAAIQITGQGGATNDTGSYGVVVEGGKIQTSGVGTLTINGTGGTCTGGNSGFANSLGVAVAPDNAVIPAGGVITSTGTGVNAGNISITGIAGDGGNGGAQGIRVDSPGTVTTVDGSITFDGTGAACGNACLGTSIRGAVTATGTGAINITGTGANTTGAFPTHGVNVRSGGAVTASNGNITVTGTGGNGTDNAGFDLAPVGTPGTGTLQTTGTGNIIIKADRIRIRPTASATINAAANAVSLRPKTVDIFIDLGSTTDTTADLELSDGELDRITCGTLNIGDNNSESITVTADITRSASTNMSLTAGCDIVISGGQVNTGGGTLLLDSGPSPDAVRPTKSGTDVTASTLSFGSDLSIVINGLTVDTDYTQLNVSGNVDLNGVTLALSGSHSPAVGQTFTIVNNAGGNPITGTFMGLAEGATIPNFLTPGASATISYVSGTGNNDVVLTVQTVPVAEISVEQPELNDLTDGSAFVDFGNEDVGVAGSPVTFTIRNGGPDALTITSVTSDNSDFAVNTSSMTSPVAAGGSTTFTVTFTPSLAGLSAALIQINNNDSDENPFDIDVEGTGTCPTELVVNNTGDDGDANPSDGICETPAGNGVCTLRAAIEEANDLAGNCGHLTISFDIPGTDGGHVYYKDDGSGSLNGTVSAANVTTTSVSDDVNLPTIGVLAKDPDYPNSWWQIKPATPLPALTVDVTINGYTQTGAVANTKHLNEGNDAILRIELNGSLLTNNDEIGLELTAESSSEIRGLVIYYFPTDIRAAGDSGETIAGNFLGTDVSGTLVDTNPTPLGVRVGVYVDDDEDTIIGGDFPADRNLISGHSGEGGVGIWIAADWAVVEGNYIGTDRNGTVALANSYGVLIAGGSGNTVGCYVLDGDNVISGNGTGVRINGGSYNYIVGNFIGTDRTGQLPVPNGTGVVLSETSYNFIGEPDFGNVISGNTGDGVKIGNSFANIVDGNLIGVASDGTTALGNGENGVEISGGSEDNLIGFFDDGGTFITERKGESANSKAGSSLAKRKAGSRAANSQAADSRISERKIERQRHRQTTHGNTILGNTTLGNITDWKSTDGKTGSKTSAAANISPAACGCSPGGNTIANNGANGVQVSNASDIHNFITQNSMYSNVLRGINLNAESDPANGVTLNDGDNPGTVPIDPDSDTGPNQLQNFPVITSADVTTQTIAGTLNSTPDEDFLIQFFVSPSGSCDPSGYGEGKKFIGFIFTNFADSAGNVSFTFNGPSSPFAAGDVITATATDYFGNTSEFSQCFVVPAAPATPNVSVTVTPASVAENGGTDLVYQFSRTDTTGSLTVSFEVSGSAAFGTDYTQTGAASLNSSAGTVTFGAGAGTVNVTIDPTPDTAPEGDEDVNLRVVPGSGYNVTNPDIATATITDDDCPASLLVNSNGDSPDANAGDGVCDTDSGTPGSQCTLRAAIQEVNALNVCALFIEINFNIPGAGVHTITPATPLPSIQHAVTINGYSQPGAIENTSTGANNALLLIELTGASAGSGADGLVLQAGGTVIKGLVINRFGGVAIMITSSGNEIIGNFIGTDTTGMLAADVNTVPYGNDAGVLILNGAGNQIGCAFAEERNIISGNLDDGVQITGMSSFFNFVQGNFIGVQRDGVSPLGNGGVGIEIYEGGVSTLIGGETVPPPSQDPGTPAPAGNIIAFNGEEGVLITAAPDISNQIMQNSIYSNGLNAPNGALGINLVKPASPGPVDPANGVTANDAGDGDSGPNNLQNFPVITSADVGTQTINGTLNSTPNRFNFIVEFFRSPECDPSGYGEGKTYIGSVTVDTDSNGDASFSLSSPLSAFGHGEAITATATDGIGNTSEFSQCFVIPTPPVPNVSVAVASPTPAVVPEDGATNLVFQFTRTITAGALTVNFDVAGTATFGSDYAQSGAATFNASSGTVTFSDGNATVDVTIDPTPDINPEGDETVILTITAGSLYNVGSPATDTGTIQDNDPCPTSFTVNSNSDTGASDATPGDGICATGGGACTLRAAIEEANALINCGTIEINFDIGSSNITLASGQLSVEHNVNIVGPTANSIVIDGNGASRVFAIGSDNTVSIANLTIMGGNAAAGNGGGILNPGTLILNGVTLSGNSAVDGGAIWSTTNNSLTLINTTISGNNASGNGGGLYNDIGQAALTNVTIAYNTANSDSLGAESGGGIFVASGDVLLHNTIVADNLKALSLGTTPDDVSGTVLASSSYNVIGTDDGGLTNGGANHNQVGVVSALLTTLKNNGGPAFTHALVYNSPAVDLGDDCVVTGCSGNSPVVATDQRGRSRPSDGDNNTTSIVDIGAYERQLTEIRDVPFTSLTNVDIVDAIVTLPCTSGQAQPDAAQPDSIAPARVAPVVTLTLIDAAPLNSLTRPPNLVIGNSSSPALPAFEVTTTASYQPPATVCFYLPSITNESFFNGLKILHREAGPNTTYGDSDDVMVDRTRATNPTDFANKLVCSEVSSFSAFAIAKTVTPTAANGSVSGQILDNNGNPVEGAAVRMTGTQNRLTVTDAAGNYHFDDVDTNGFYTVVPSRANFAFSPTQRSFSQQGQNTNAAFNATLANAGLNPLDTTVYFVRQQYVDFLGREPDEAGLNFWVNNIESCGANAQCREAKRIDTSAAFFLSIEFQETGYLVHRMYQSAYGDMPGTPVPLSRSEFKPDTAAIGNGVVVLKSGWETVLDSNKQAFAAAFVQRARFASAYQSSLTPSEFVDKLFANAGVTPLASERTAAISEFGAAATSADAAARGRALRRVAENGKLAQQEFNQAFVLMEYFGYLRRNPSDAPEQTLDYTGFNFWLSKLNTFNGNFHQAEMVKAFLTSIEYRGRFQR